MNVIQKVRQAAGNRHPKITAKIIWLRIFGQLRTLLRVAGLATVVVAALNMFLFRSDPILGLYRTPIADAAPQWMVFNAAEAGVALPDVVLLAIGAVIVWWS